MKLTDFYKELKSNRAITFINVFGYSVAVSACLIIGLFVFNQLNYDKFNTNADQIFRLNYIQNQKGTDNATTNHHWYQVLPEEVPGVEKAARFGQPWEQSIEYNKNNLKGIGATGDKEIFDLFSFPVLQKEAGNFFEKPNSVALSKSLAGKIFGSENLIGKNITLNYGDQYTVTAVFDDIPANSTLQFEFITNAKDFLDEYGDRMKNHCDCLSCCILCHEQMAGKFCLQDQSGLVDLCPGRFAGTGDCPADGELAKLESRHAEPGGGSSLRIGKTSN